MRTSTFRLGLALVLVSGAIAYATLPANGGDAPRPAPAAGKADSRLVVRGKVDGLYPGAAEAVRVKVRNRYRRALELRRVRTRALDASAKCTSDQLVVERVKRRRKPLPPRTRRKVRVEVAMLPSAPDACQGAEFPLRFRARAARP